MNRSIESRSAVETRRLGERLGRVLEAGDVVALRGELGAGKTCFVQGLARGLGVPAGTPVTSPTFNIALEYAGRIPFVHIDLYRLFTDGELDEIGFEHYLASGAACAIEWLDRFPGRAPRDRIEVALSITGPRSRTLTALATGERSRRLAREWLPSRPTKIAARRTR